jgi:hypothetical protein
MSSEGEGTKQIKGVDTNHKGRKPMSLGRTEVAGARSETILESKRPTGEPRHGIDPGKVHRSFNGPGGLHNMHPLVRAHKANERGQ